MTTETITATSMIDLLKRVLKKSNIELERSQLLDKLADVMGGDRYARAELGSYLLGGLYTALGRLIQDYEQQHGHQIDARVIHRYVTASVVKRAQMRITNREAYELLQELTELDKLYPETIYMRLYTILER